MRARIELYLNGRREHAWVPTRDQHDYPLSDELILSLLRTTLVDLWYLVKGDFDEDALWLEALDTKGKE